MSELKTKWPEMRTPNLLEVGALEALSMCLNDERARAEAAIERLRLATKHLQSLTDMLAITYQSRSQWPPGLKSAKNALAAIGPIPGEQT